MSGWTFGPAAVAALHRTLVAGPAALAHREASRAFRPASDAPSPVDLSGSGAQPPPTRRPVPVVTYTPATRTPATRPWVRDLSLSPRGPADPSLIGIVPEDYPTDTYPAPALRDMRDHAAAWTEEHATRTHGAWNGANWVPPVPRRKRGEAGPVDTRPALSSGTDPHGWYDPQPRTVHAVRFTPAPAPHRALRVGDPTPVNIPGRTAWTLPNGCNLPAGEITGRTPSGGRWGERVAQERTAKGTPRFSGQIPADPQSYGGHLPTPWIAPPSHRRLSLPLATAWGEAGQPKRFTVRDLRNRKNVTDPTARGALIVTTVPLPILSLTGASLSDLGRVRWVRVLSTVDGAQRVHAPRRVTVDPFALGYSTTVVRTRPTRTHPLGRVLGEPTRWGASDARSIVLAPASPTVVAQAAAMVAAALIG